MSFEDAVDVLDHTQVIAIVTTRSAGTSVATPIWSVVVDGVPYLRSAYGPDSWWYRHALSGRPVALAMGDGAIAETDRDAALSIPREPIGIIRIPTDDPIQVAIDDEIQRKYAGAQPSSIESMLSSEALACTFRISAP